MRRGAELVGVACLASGESSPAAAYVEFRGKHRIASGYALQSMGICCQLGNTSATAWMILVMYRVLNAVYRLVRLLSSAFRMDHRRLQTTIIDYFVGGALQAD